MHINLYLTLTSKCVDMAPPIVLHDAPSSLAPYGGLTGITLSMKSLECVSAPSMRRTFSVTFSLRNKSASPGPHTHADAPQRRLSTRWTCLQSCRPAVCPAPPSPHPHVSEHIAFRGLQKLPVRPQSVSDDIPSTHMHTEPAISRRRSARSLQARRPPP